MSSLRIDVWSDIACPWCYVGKRRLEAALERFPERAAVEVVWRSFELDPTRPAVESAEVPYAARLAHKYGVPLADAERMIATMTQTAAGEGLDYRFDRIRPGNTFDAHRLAHLAREKGLGDAAEERLMRAYLTEGEALGERETLVRLAGEIGLVPAEAREVLEKGAYAREVRADEAEARRLGIGAVPTFVIGGRYTLRGAQPPDALLAGLNAAWEEHGNGPPAGEACGPAGCS